LYRQYDSKKYHSGIYIEIDRIRDIYLKSMGWVIIRINHKELDNFTSGNNLKCLNLIKGEI
jgi:very-short-patch-repair endonuclease